MPDHVLARFERIGKKYYFPSGDPAFKDHGTRLTTRSENSELVATLIEVAQARGWDSVRVRGSERFRQEAWRQARLAGLTVRGYRASELDQKLLVRTMVNERRSGAESMRGSEPESANAARGEDTPTAGVAAARGCGARRS